MVTLGDNIRKARKKMGLTQEELASVIGVTSQAVSRWESGAGMPDISMLIPLAKALREAGVAVEVYPEATKLKKQFDYADKKAIPFISINGSSEIEAGTVNLKNLVSGEQKAFPAQDIDAILDFLS